MFERVRLYENGVAHVRTKEALYELIQNRLRGYQFIIVANREPYLHRYAGNQIRYAQPASDMATLLDSLMRACQREGHGQVEVCAPAH